MRFIVLLVMIVCMLGVVQALTLHGPEKINVSEDTEVTFELYNNTSEPLTNVNITVDGPLAAEVLLEETTLDVKTRKQFTILFPYNEKYSNQTYVMQVVAESNTGTTTKQVKVEFAKQGTLALAPQPSVSENTVTGFAGVSDNVLSEAMFDVILFAVALVLLIALIPRATKRFQEEEQ